MSAATLQHQFASLLTWQLPPVPDLVPTGIPDIDFATGGIPRGALTEIVGPASSGRTSLLHSILAGAAARDEVCALVDTNRIATVIKNFIFISRFAFYHCQSDILMQKPPV